MDYPTFEGQIGDCERADIDALGLARMLADADERDIRVHSVICIRNGVRVLDISAEPFRTDLPQETYSMSKSFVSAAIGIAQENGMLRLDDKVIDLLGRSGMRHRPYLEELSVRHLLTMMVGQSHNDSQKIWAKPDWIEAFFDTPIVSKPGTVFAYNNFASYILSAIIQARSGRRLVRFLDTRLFQRIGVSQVYWEDFDRGVDWGASGLYVSPDAMARYGFLLLNNGRWKDQRILDGAYLLAATSKQVDSKPPIPEWTEYTHGYGFQFWRNSFGGYRASGMLMQELVVVPEHSLVLVLLGSHNKRTPEPLMLVRDQLVPACRRGFQGGIQQLGAACQSFERRLDWLPRRAHWTKCDGRLYRLERPIVRGRIFNIESNVSAVGLERVGDDLFVLLEEAGALLRLACGIDGRYRVNDYQYNVGGEVLNIRAALIGEWQDEKTFYFEIRPLCNNMWMIYWIRFRDAFHIELRTYLDARFYEGSSEKDDRATTLIGTLDPNLANTQQEDY